MLAGQTATNWETSLLRRNPLKLPNDIALGLGEVVVRGIKVVCAFAVGEAPHAFTSLVALMMWSP
jgi:hypothetical protein